MPLNARGSQSSEAPILIGESRALSAVRDSARLAARTDAKVLILGETGVGKDLVARSIHHQSARRQQPFVAVNCGSMPDSLLESELFGHVRGSFTDAYRDKVGLLARADQGTLFLDELGEMSLRMQAMLLRFAETGEVQRVGSERPEARTNVRLISATNRDLRTAIVDRTFREDLYYRLNVIQIHLPPLRERMDDVPALLQHYLRRAAETHHVPGPSLAPEAARRLHAYRWPGNVRELRNVTERLTVQCAGGVIEPDDLPEEILASQSDVPAVCTVPTPSLADTSAEIVARLWVRFAGGEDFWSVAYQPFRERQITRADLTALIDRGLRETSGSYRELLRIFNLPSSDYKRLHAFLYQQECNLPVKPYRQMKVSSASPRPAGTLPSQPGLATPSRARHTA